MLNALRRFLLVLPLLVVGSLTVSSTMATAPTCQFLSAPGATPAFCDDLSGGVRPGGAAGDLDEAKWSIGRVDGEFSNTDLLPFPVSPATPCKAGVTSVNSDNDVLVCDTASGHAGQFETAMEAQDYALLSLRPRQPFDFTGRTGTITYNVDAATTGPLGWWTSVFVTADPVPGANNTARVSGMTPRNGMGMSFDGNNCSGALGTAVKLNDVYTYSDYAETDVPVGNGTCIQTQAGKQNHIEIRLSQTHVDVWASDFSTDGSQTFPNFRLIGSGAISLNFSQGYVHFQHGQRAPKKYAASNGFPAQSSTYYWSDLGFDGPGASHETGYRVPDALTHDPNVVGDFPDNSNNLNLGYGLLTAPNSTYTCCPQTAASAFTLPNVDLTGVTSAKLTFSVFFVSTGSTNSSTYAIKYRFNGGAWQVPSPAPEFSKAQMCQAWGGAVDCNWSMAFSVAVPVSTIAQGANTLEVASDGTSNSYPPILANLELLTFGGSGTTPTSTPTPGTTATPTATPTVTATPTSTPAAVCQVLTLVNGVQHAYTRPASFCTDQ